MHCLLRLSQATVLDRVAMGCHCMRRTRRSMSRRSGLWARRPSAEHSGALHRTAVP
jgi:hypothetical protein